MHNLPYLRFMRLHGPQEACKGKYDGGALIDWAGGLYSWAHQGKEIFCYFDNDEAGKIENNVSRLPKIINS